MSGSLKDWFSRRGLRGLVYTALLASLGCSVIASTDAPQCATDVDCYVKFGGGLTCQSGGCVAAEANVDTQSRVVTTLSDCRSTQECVAAQGEGWFCNRPKNDPQKRGRCVLLTPTSDCQVYGAYKDDSALLVGAMIPSGEEAEVGAAIRSGIARAVGDWDGVRRSLLVPSPDRPAAPRTVAVVACNENGQQTGLRNLFLAMGAPLVLGPGFTRPGNEETSALATELTTANILLLSPTAIEKPADGTNVANYFYRTAGAEADYAAEANAIATNAGGDVLLVRRADTFGELAASVKAAFPGATELTYTSAEALTAPPAANAFGTIIVAGYGESAAVASKLQRNLLPVDGRIVLLPWAATPTSLATIRALPAGVQSRVVLLTLRTSTTIPTPSFPVGFGAAEAYDTTYLAMYAVAAAGPDITGETLLNGLARVTDQAGTPLNATATDITAGLQSLAPEGSRAHVVGSTGALLFSNQADSPSHHARVASTMRLGQCVVGAENIVCID